MKSDRGAGELMGKDLRCRGQSVARAKQKTDVSPLVARM